VSVHFENFVFVRVDRASNFAQRHLCALEALEADRYPCRNRQEVLANTDGCKDQYRGVFERVYDACVDRITAAEDPAMRVFFTPDAGYFADGASHPGEEAVSFLKQQMRGAETSVDMAIEHYSDWSLASTHARNARDGLRARLVLDDQTLYLDGGGSSRTASSSSASSGRTRRSTSSCTTSTS
jgi:hypothetical protein